MKCWFLWAPGKCHFSPLTQTAGEGNRTGQTGCEHRGEGVADQALPPTWRGCRQGPGRPQDRFEQIEVDVPGGREFRPGAGREATTDHSFLHLCSRYECVKLCSRCWGHHRDKTETLTPLQQTDNKGQALNCKWL